MKALPKYLENIVDHMAVAEANHGGMRFEEAKKTFTDELINESLTAKANPTPAAQENPTIKPFHEIYEAAGKQFAESPLGSALGFSYSPGRSRVGTSGTEPASAKTGGDKSEGRKFFEDLRNFANNTADEVVRGVFKDRTKRNTSEFDLAMPYKEKTSFNKSSGEYPTTLKRKSDVKGKLVTKGEDQELHYDVMKRTEEMRYVKLLVSSLVVGLIEPLFQLKKEELMHLLYALEQGVPVSEAATPKHRRAFVEKVLELMRVREGNVNVHSASYEPEKLRSNLLLQLAALDKPE